MENSELMDYRLFTFPVLSRKTNGISLKVNYRYTQGVCGHGVQMMMGEWPDGEWMCAVCDEGRIRGWKGNYG